MAKKKRRGFGWLRRKLKGKIKTKRKEVLLPERDEIFYKTKKPFTYDSEELPEIPMWYKEKEFTQDVAGMFRGDEKRYGRHNLEVIRSRDAPFFNIDEWASFQRFFIQFPQSEIYEKIKDSFNTPDEAAKWFLNLLSAASQSLPGCTNIGDLFSKGMDELMEILQKMMDMVGFAPGKGHMDIQDMKKRIDILKALEKVRVKYKSAMTAEKKRIEVREPDVELEPVAIRTIMDVPKVFASEHAYLLDETYWIYRMITGKMMKPKWFKYEETPKSFVMLLDVSGSMSGATAIFAAASAIALIQNAEASGLNKAKIIPFDGRPHQAIEGGTKECVERLLEMPFSGGGTSIDNALKAADEEDVDEIILITDGADTVTYTPKAKLYTIFCSRSGRSYGNANEYLRDISYKYETVDPNPSHIGYDEDGKW